MKTAPIALLALATITSAFVACGDSASDGETAGTSSSSSSGGGSTTSGTTTSSGGGEGGASTSTTTTSTGTTCTPTGDEDTAEACDDGLDNDCDDFVDCNDFDCSSTAPCIKPAENSNPRCFDGLDNDGDGKTDCEDTDCYNPANQRGVYVCQRETTNKDCSDNADNDGDGMIDCADPDCQGESIVVCNGTTPVVIAPAQFTTLANARCSNGLNDDAGGNFIDCGDRSCSGNPEVTHCYDAVRENTNALCADGIDNDLDGRIDCADFNCQAEGIVVCNGNTPVAVDPAQYAALTTARCTDGINNDDPGNPNGPKDCADFSCMYTPDSAGANCENTDAQCMDNVDNDSDTFTDCNDNSCRNNPYVSSAVCAHELTPAECSDGLDNNGNGFADCRDNSCNGTAACTNVNP